MNRFLKTTVLTATAALVFGLGANAQAMMLQGTIGFGGTYMPTPTGDLNTATGIDITFAQALIASGDFDTLVNTATDGTLGVDDTNTTLTYNDFDFLPPSTPIAPLWDNGVVSFDLMFITLVDQSIPNQINIQGTGIFSAAGFDDTEGTWEFTANQTINGQIGGFTFSTSESGAPLPEVPEPGTMLLMGSGLVGLGFWRKFKK